jgi:aspartyl-tRNA(Asn)/glutamyl-tRNA(Gln) amidotransferase subunit B
MYSQRFNEPPRCKQLGICGMRPYPPHPALYPEGHASLQGAREYGYPAASYGESFRLKEWVNWCIFSWSYNNYQDFSRCIVDYGDYEGVMGLEVHAHLLTKSKIFCGCSTAFGAEPNSHTCPTCMGLPGALPVLNKKVVDFAIRLGLALHCGISRKSIFARKNYYYPDLPKGYQISQYEEPICTNGYLTIYTNGEKKRIRVNRVHMEEDAGKLVHENTIETSSYSMVDYNRSSTPLLEIVSEPDIATPEEAVIYLKVLRDILLYLEICDGNMEEGSFRCDANVSVRKKGTEELGTRTEMKNLNSFKHVEKSLDYEIGRQIELIKKGGQVVQETRLFNADEGVTYSMRGKEEAHDYRYFPEPDLLPLIVDDAWIDEIRKILPELPMEKMERFIDEYNLPRYDVEILSSDKELADYFEETIKLFPDHDGTSQRIQRR